MQILQPKSQLDYIKINKFFSDMWHEEFNLERHDRIDEYKDGTVLYIEHGDEFIGAIFSKIKDGKPFLCRFGVEKMYRGYGYGRVLMESLLESLTINGAKELYVNSEITKKEMYQKFGFELIDEPKSIGNTKSVYMRKEL